MENSKDSGVKCGFEKDKKAVFKIEMGLTENVIYMYDEEQKDFIKVLSSAYENEYPNSGIGLGNYGTRVAFTKVQFYEKGYYEAI